MENKTKQSNNNNEEYYYNQGISLYNEGEYEDAIQMFNKAIQINPNKAVYYSKKGNCLADLGQNEKAILMYNQAIQVDPNCADYYSNKGLCLSDLGRYEEALDVHNKAIQINPNIAVYYSNRGSCLQDLGQFDEALLMCNKAIEINSNKASYYNNKGNCLRNIGQYEEALEMYNKAIQIDPQDPDYFCNKGICLSELGRYEEALLMFNEAIQMNPNNAIFYSSKGNCLLDKGQYQEGLLMYNRAIQLNPNKAEWYTNKGICLYNLGQNEDALSMYDKGIELNLLDILTYANKAVLLNQIGKSQEARECIQMCSKLLKEGNTKGLSQGNIKFIKQTIELQQKIEKESQNILKNVEQIGGNQNEKQSLFNAAKKYTNLINDITEIQVAKNLAQKNKNKQEENQTISLEQLLDKQNVINEKLNDEKKTPVQAEQFLFEEIKKLQDLLMQQQQRINDQEKKINQQEKQINQQEKKIEILNENVVEINRDLIDAGVKQKAELNRELQNLANNEEQSVFNYYKTFYWTILNIIQTYRIISTNLVSGNYKSDATEFLENNGDKIEEGMKVCLEAGKEICKGVISSIPVVGNIFDFLDKTIGVVVSAAQAYEDKKDQIQFQNKVNAINQVISSRFQTDEELSIKLADLAIRLTKLKKDIINFPNPSKKAQKGSILSWVSNQIQNVEASHFSKTELHDLNDEGVKLALQDVVLLISYITLYSDRIIKLQKQEIVDILFNIVDKQLDGLLAIEVHDSPQDKSDNQEPQVRDQTCQCNIF